MYRSFLKKCSKVQAYFVTLSSYTETQVVMLQHLFSKPAKRKYYLHVIFHINTKMWRCSILLHHCHSETLWLVLESVRKSERPDNTLHSNCRRKNRDPKFCLQLYHIKRSLFVNNRCGISWSQWYSNSCVNSICPKFSLLSASPSRISSIIGALYKWHFLII